MSKVSSYIHKHEWNIAFLDNSLEDIVQGVPMRAHWMKHSLKNTWFADPWILDVTDEEIFVLVEEFTTSINRGRIAELRVDRKTFQLLECTIILDLPTHLSFPAIYRNGKDVYVYPENSQSGESRIYRYDRQKKQCLDSIVLAEYPLTDAVMADYWDEKMLFTTISPTSNNGNLWIMKHNGTRYQKHLYYEFSEKIGRMAGELFELKGKVYRPAQESNNGYGHSIVLQEVVRNDDGSFSFAEIQRCLSPSSRYNLGMHTLNHYKGVLVIDAKGYSHPHAYRCYEIIKNFIK